MGDAQCGGQPKALIGLTQIAVANATTKQFHVNAFADCVHSLEQDLSERVKVLTIVINLRIIVEL